MTETTQVRIEAEAGQTTEVIEKARQAKDAARSLRLLPPDDKDRALRQIADALVDASDEITRANKIDLDEAKERGVSAALRDRLALDEARVKAMANGIREVALLPDPIGDVVRSWKRPNGLEFSEVRVPLGVIGIIYEARPNVTADAAALCLKTGNASLLRGGSEAIESNKAIASVIRRALVDAGLPENAVQLVENTDRAAAGEMMKANGLIDVLIPRGGPGLINAVVSQATVPVIETGAGVCHIYVDEQADKEKTEAIVMNAKIKRPSVCNAVETLLIHDNVAADYLPGLAEQLVAAGVELRGCAGARSIFPAMKEVTPLDWEEEYLDLILAIKIVRSADEAIDHIGRYSTGHSDAIVTENYSTARRFTSHVDSAAVYVNASTYFTDGNQFGFGAEIGISTQKLHARGPMGLAELTSTKYVVLGDGQIRP